MNKQYLMLNLESDTFKGMKADFDELLQQLLEKLFAGRIADGSISMKLSVSLTETYSETMGKDISVPLFKHKTTANYTEKLENAGAVSLPNTYLEYDEELGEFVLKPCGGEQDMFAEQEAENETHSIYAWARKLGINPKTLGERIRRGWSVERALTQAVEGR